MQTYP